MISRFDNTKSFILNTIKKNDRLKTYEVYIQYAIENGYEVLGVVDFYNNRSVDKKHFVLRHDVDFKTIATRKMFETEKKLGVKSTYYFRELTMDYDLIKEMESEGFEVGFHYETIANYIKSNRVTCIENRDIEKCREILKNEINLNKEKYNLRSVCAHGAPENIRIGISNNILLENEKYEDYGIICEAYDKNMYEFVDAHIMDQNICFGCGFAYKTNPIDSINERKKNIVFLAHPHNWFETGFDKVLNISRMIRGKYSLESDREFKRIAGG